MGPFATVWTSALGRHDMFRASTETSTLTKAPIFPIALSHHRVPQLRHQPSQAPHRIPLAVLISHAPPPCIAVPDLGIGRAHSHVTTIYHHPPPLISRHGETHQCIIKMGLSQMHRSSQHLVILEALRHIAGIISWLLVTRYYFLLGLCFGAYRLCSS